ncbi:MAG: cupredoxin domain-containing protein, partial [Pseudomonadota bacterium]
KVRLLIENQDSTPEEFDSFDLNREKVLYPNRKSVIYIGPLTPGRYEFFGEFSPNTARGAVIATEKEDSDANN